MAKVSALLSLILKTLPRLVFEPEAITCHPENVKMISKATETGSVGGCARERGLCERCVLAGGEPGPLPASLGHR